MTMPEYISLEAKIYITIEALTRCLHCDCNNCPYFEECDDNESIRSAIELLQYYYRELTIPKPF